MIFLRKYITSFNYYSKTISLYKCQVDDINNKTYKIMPDEEAYVNPDTEHDTAQKDEMTKNKLKSWIIIVIVCACAIVFIAAIITIILLVLRLKKFRKIRAAELIDDNYEYTESNNIN